MSRNWTEAQLDEVIRKSHVRKVTQMGPQITQSSHPGRPKGTKDVVKRYTRHDRLRDVLTRDLESRGHKVSREHYFAKPERAFRADICIVERKFIVELQGQVHRIKDQFLKDILRTQWALIHGWKIFPVTPAQVESGDAIAAIVEALR